MSKKQRRKSDPTHLAAKTAAPAARPKRQPEPGTSPSATASSGTPRRNAPTADKPSRAAAPSVVLSEGQPAPPFDLPRDGGGRVALNAFAERKLVLFFYPRANTPGCTREAMDFSRLASEFAAHGTNVIGLSADSINSQNSFRNKYKLSVPLVSDEEMETLKAYGVWGEKTMYGKVFMGIRRTTVLIDAKGRIARIWRNVKVDGHADEVLAAARAL